MNEKDKLSCYCKKCDRKNKIIDSMIKELIEQGKQQARDWDQYQYQKGDEKPIYKHQQYKIK